jgi:GrpB-like predicted nucleotidyltransferase (UPF0157 family)
MPDQAVQIAEYDGAWPARFLAQRDRVEAILAPWLAAPVQHIGSTSVPGLAAKPIIDMLAPVRSFGEAGQAAADLIADGWMIWPDDPARHYRLWFLRPRPQARTHQLQVMSAADPHAAALLAFRDALRADPRLGREYARLKVELATRHEGNRNAYTNAKDEFVARVLRAASVAPPPRDRLPE